MRATDPTVAAETRPEPSCDVLSVMADLADADSLRIEPFRARGHTGENSVDLGGACAINNSAHAERSIDGSKG